MSPLANSGVEGGEGPLCCLFMVLSRPLGGFGFSAFLFCDIVRNSTRRAAADRSRHRSIRLAGAARRGNFVQDTDCVSHNAPCTQQRDEIRNNDPVEAAIKRLVPAQDERLVQH